MDLIEIKEILDDKKAERERLLGKKSSYVDQLKELGYSTIKKAEQAMVKMEKELAKMEKDYAAELKDFEKNYEELLA